MTPWARGRAGWVMLTGTGAAASVAFGLLVFASVFACLVIPRENAALRSASLERTLAASRPSDRAVIATVSLTDLAAGAQLGPSDIAAARGRLASLLDAGGLPLASQPPAWSSVSTGYAPVTGAGAAAGGGRAQVEVMYRTALAGYSHVVAGRLPASASPAGGHDVVQAAVTTATAARFGLRVGSTLRMRTVRLMITGIIRAEHPATNFWTEAPVAAAPALVQGSSGLSSWVGTVFVGPGALPVAESALNPEYTQITWGFPVAVSRLTANRVSPLLTSLDNMTSSGLVLTGASGPVVVTVDSQLPGILAPYVDADRAVAPLLGLLYVSLAVTGAVVVLLGAWLVAEHRHAELALMRARGAALRQVGWLALRGSAVVAVVAVAAAAALAVWLTPGDASQVSLWLAAVTVGVTLAGPVLITAVWHRVPGPGTAGRATGRPARRRSGIRRIVIEAALLAVTIGGLVVLRVQGLSAGGTNLYPSAAPVLIAVPAAIIVLRGYPAVSRELARVAGRSRGVVAFVGLARATRTSPGAALPAFALVLALAMVTFAAMVSAAVSRGQVEASWRQVGADAIVEAEAGHPITAAVQHQIASVPGVTGTATGVIYAGTLPATGSELTAVFVTPAAYAAVVDEAPGTRFPLAALSRSGAGRPGAIIPAVATPAAAQLVGSAPVQFSPAGQSMTIRLAGRVGAVPGVAGGPVVVLPLQALGQNPPAPGLMLVGGPHLDGRRLSAIVARELPGGTVTLRAAALAALTGAPVPGAAKVTIVQAAATAAGFGVLVLLLSLLLGARTRDLTLARLATMGLRRRQAQVLLAVEELPQVAAAAIGGIACAWALAPLVGPSIDLSVFTGPGPSVVVAPDPVALAAAAAGLIMAALLALAAQAVITYRRGSTTALRITE